MVYGPVSVLQSLPSTHMPASLAASGLTAAKRRLGQAVILLLALSCLVVLASPSEAQYRHPRNRAIHNAVSILGGAMDAVDSLKILSGKIKGLAERARTDTVGASRLEGQAASLAEQMDILTGDMAVDGVNIVGEGARNWSVDLKGASYKVKAFDLSAKALGLSQFDFQSPAGIDQTLQAATAATQRFAAAGASYAKDRKALKAKMVPEPRPSAHQAGPIAGGRRMDRPASSGGSGGGNALINQIMNQVHGQK